MIKIKKPSFDHNSEMKTDVFNQQFDFIIAQSIFSHCGKDLITTALNNFYHSLKDTGIAAVTFIHGKNNFTGNGWIYPGCVEYIPETIEQLGTESKLFIKQIPWHHPRQTWYLLSK
jgi:cyclopropane fatty-acyl-phospholipid synthase-like methyltransferase